MKLRFPLFLLTTLLATGVAFSQPPTPSLNNTKIYQPDNNPVNTNAGIIIGNPGPGSSFQVMYTNFSNAFQSIKVMNTGSAGGVDPGGDICVNVYVFDTSQHFQDCCYCRVSPNGLGVMNLNGQYTPSQLVIKLVATYPGNTYKPDPTATTCDPSTPTTGIDPTKSPVTAQGTAFDGVYTGNQQYVAPGQAAWLDVNPLSTTTHNVLEFHQSSFSKGEAANLAYQCGVKHLGVGQGGTSQCPTSVCQ